ERGDRGALMFFAVRMFCVGAGFVLGAYWLSMNLPERLAARQLERRLQDVAGLAPAAEGEQTVVRNKAEGPLPALDRLVGTTGATSWLARLIEHSGGGGTATATLLSAA